MRNSVSFDSAKSFRIESTTKKPTYLQYTVTKNAHIKTEEIVRERDLT